MSEIKKNILTLIIAIVFGLFAVEGILRFFEVKDFALVTRVTEDGYVVHKSNLDRYRYESESQRKVHIKTNQEGFVGDDSAPEKPKDVLRVAVFGDSFTEAFQVDYENTFTYLLKDKIKRSPGFSSTTYKDVEIMNFGVGGLGTVDAMKYYKRYAINYKPDVVVLAFYLGNDNLDNSNYYSDKDKLLFEKEKWDTVPQLGALQQKEFNAFKDRLFRKFALIRFSDKVVRSSPKLNALAVKLGLYRPPLAKSQIDLDIPFWHYYYLDPLDEERAKHVKFSADLISNFKKEVEKDNAKFVLMLIPEGMTVDQKLLADFKDDHPALKNYNFNPVGMENKLIEQIDPSVYILALRESMEEKTKQNQLLYLNGIHHFSEAGHEVAADKLAEVILSSN